MYNDFKNLNYNQTNHKIQKIRKMVDRLYGDYEYKKHLIADLNKQLKIEINLPSETNLPDLTITNITAIDKGHYFEFTITIKNIGEIATTEETNLITTIEGEAVELIVPALDVNETVDRYTSFPYDPDAVDTYGLNVNSEVNEERNIEESDYSNNIKNRDFEIKENYIVTGFSSHIHNLEGIEINSILSQVGFPNDLLVTPPEHLYNLYIDGNVYLGGAIDETEHNLYSEILAGTYIVNLYLTRLFSILYVLGNITIVENSIKNIIFVLPRYVTTVELYNQDESGYVYKYTGFHSSGLVFGLQGYSMNPISIEDSGDGFYAAFASAQSNLIATTSFYDLAGTGVRG